MDKDIFCIIKYVKLQYVLLKSHSKNEKFEQGYEKKIRKKSQHPVLRFI